MKFKLRFQRRVSVIITIIACAASIMMMVRTFGFPESRVVEIAMICVVLLLLTLLVAAPIALALRWWRARRGE